MEWKPIPGYSGYYASDRGHIKRNDKILCTQITKKGYVVVNATNNDGMRTSRFVHRLVSMAFHDNPNDLPQVNHKDGVKNNNRVENLEWCTNLANYEHAKLNGLRPKVKYCEDHPRATVTNKEALEIRSVKISSNGRVGITRIDLAKKYGITLSAVKDIRTGRSFKHLWGSE